MLNVALALEFVLTLTFTLTITVTLTLTLALLSTLVVHVMIAIPQATHLATSSTFSSLSRST